MTDKKPKKQPSVWGLMTVRTEAGIDRICRDIERRRSKGEKDFSVEEHRRLRREVFGEGEPK
jgi:hypothetical protein